MKFSIKDFFGKRDQIRRQLLLKKSLMENFIFCVVTYIANCSNEIECLGN